MKKIKQIIKILSFSLILGILLFVLSCMAKPVLSTGSDHYNIGGLYCEKENSLDVVYVGGSAVCDYYAPLQAWEKYGIVSYDYAANTVQLELYQTMIKELLKTQKPELIILDARALQYRDKDNVDAQPPSEVSYRNTLTEMKLSRNKMDFINTYVEKVTGESKASFYFDLIKFHDNLTKPRSGYLEIMFGKYKNPYNGFRLVPSYTLIGQRDFSTSVKKPVSGETEAILNDLLDYMDETGIDYLFTVSPYAEKKEHKMTFNYVQEIIENRGYRFIDCNEYVDQMELDFETDLYDNNHVNIYGAEKYTDFLSQYILTNYESPNRKEDPDYVFMNTYLDEWHLDVKSTKAIIDQIISEVS